jgi:hypothetical protein
MIGSFLSYISGFFQNLISVVLRFLGDLFGYLFQNLFDLIKLIFNPIFIVIAIIFYFIAKLATLIFLLLKIILGIGKVFVSLVTGIVTTLSGFTYTNATRDDGTWTNLFSHVSDGFSYFQLDNVAYVLMFLVWFGTAFAAVRIISSMGSGGD